MCNATRILTPPGTWPSLSRVRISGRTCLNQGTVCVWVHIMQCTVQFTCTGYDSIERFVMLRWLPHLPVVDRPSNYLMVLCRYGVALLNNNKYGYACHGNVLRLSLIRSPKRPDDKADMGHHAFKYALFPHKGRLLGVPSVSILPRFAQVVESV